MSDAYEKVKDPAWVAEMMTLCRDARGELMAALGKLDSAKNWGIWDILGGGFLSTIIKHHRIDAARAHIEATRGMLFRLRRELDHANLGTIMETGPSGFAALADHLFDGFFADIYVQGKISAMRRDVEGVLRGLDRVERFLTNGK